ncbi:hypothetical protein RIF29_00706 [Crotalaria pallida]|uniref:Uncharacterized protein n=1 Tax=Crotalaria pallida TaxID=3830 RepID=A0AAN9IVW1_CROPI
MYVGLRFGGDIHRDWCTEIEIAQPPAEQGVTAPMEEVDVNDINIPLETPTDDPWNRDGAVQLLICPVLNLQGCCFHLCSISGCRWVGVWVIGCAVGKGLSERALVCCGVQGYLLVQSNSSLGFNRLFFDLVPWGAGVVWLVLCCVLVRNHICQAGHHIDTAIIYLKIQKKLPSLVSFYDTMHKMIHAEYAYSHEEQIKQELDWEIKYQVLPFGEVCHSIDI